MSGLAHPVIVVSRSCEPKAWQEAWQSHAKEPHRDCFVADAPRNDDREVNFDATSLIAGMAKPGGKTIFTAGLWGFSIK